MNQVIQTSEMQVWNLPSGSSDTEGPDDSEATNNDNFKTRND